MSGSYRRILIVLAGLILTGVNQPDQGNAAQGSADNAQQPIAEASEVTPSAQVAAPTPPEPDLTSATCDQSYYDREDLDAQRDMAKWTRIMGIAAIVGIILSGIGIGLIYSTFVAAHKANQIALSAQRAWLTLEIENEGALRILPETADLNIKWTIKNIGREVAKNLRIVAYLTTLKKGAGPTDAVRLAEQETISQVMRFAYLLPGQSISNVTAAAILDINGFAQSHGFSDERLPLFVVAEVEYQLVNDGPNEPRRVTEVIRYVKTRGADLDGYPIEEAEFDVYLKDIKVLTERIT